MKKIVTIFCVIVMIIFASCGEESSDISSAQEALVVKCEEEHIGQFERQYYPMKWDVDRPVEYCQR